MSQTIGEGSVVYDWNVPGNVAPPPIRRVDVFDETLRDGVQCPSVIAPPIEAKVDILRRLSGLGVHSADISLPGAGARSVADCTRLCEMVREEKLTILPGRRVLGHRVPPQHQRVP
jgi:isopropylmalate/homocitrate/citramalate synthase